MEDLDTPRVLPGCADQILRTLEAFGFEWDGEVVYQSARVEHYRAAIARLRTAGQLYECSCSRRELSAAGAESPGYPGTCRAGPAKPGPTALRFRVSDSVVGFDDLYQGRQQIDLATCGDCIVQRRDSIASYQLAVVVDDAFQHVTRVVRGADLLASTPWQIELQAALGLRPAIYGHLPLVVEPDGAKLSKARSAAPLDPSAVSGALVSTLTLLSQRPPPELARAPIGEVWKWAMAHWHPQALVGRIQAALSASGDIQAEITGKIVGC